MSFKDLAPELLSIIVDHLCHSGEARLSKHATLSAGFRGAVESVLFSSLKLSSDELDNFERAVWSDSADRPNLLGDLSLSIVLPAYTDLECARFENVRDKRRNDEAFTGIVSRLYLLLSSRRSGSSARPLKLQLLDFFSPMDGRHRATYEQDKWDADMSKRKDLFEHRYDHSYLHLVPQESLDLPYLPRITQLVITAAQPRYVAPSAVTLLASRLPDLERVKWDLSDNERHYPTLRSSLRADFTRGLASLSTPRLQCFELNYMHETPSNEGFRNANMLRESTFDPLSIQLRNYLQMSDLVHINLKGPICLGPEFFLLEGNKGRSSLSWPQLRALYIELSHVRPDGGWYLERDADAGVESDEEGMPDDDDVLSESSVDSELAFCGSEDSFFEED